MSYPLLTEVANLKSPIVFHWTNFENALNIIKHDYFRTTQGQKFKGLSTTSDPNYIWSSSQVCFILSLPKLSKDFEVKSVEEDIHYPTGEKADESEVLIVSDSAIVNAHAYIEEIKISSADTRAQKSRDDLVKFATNYGKKFSIKITT